MDDKLEAAVRDIKNAISEANQLASHYERQVNSLNADIEGYKTAMDQSLRLLQLIRKHLDQLFPDELRTSIDEVISDLTHKVS